MTGAPAAWTPVLHLGGDAAGADGNAGPPAEPEAAAAAAASPAGTVDRAAQRGGVRQGGQATVHPGEHADVPARPPALARAKNVSRMLGGSVMRELGAGLAHNAEHGAPWREQPPSLDQLRASIRVRAAAHDILPFAKSCYIAWGYTVELPVTAAGYTLLWVMQAPARVAIAVIVWTILHAAGMAPQLPLIGLIPGVRDII